MKLLARIVVTSGCLLLLAGAAVVLAIREARLKRRLGPDYEGPLQS